PPKKGKTHILRIIRELIEFEPTSSKTNISEALKYVTNIIKKRSICFVMSDYLDEGFEDAMRLANKKHDIVALQIYDVGETDLPQAGLIKLRDAETGETLLVDSSDKDVRKIFRQNWLRHERRVQDALTRCGVDKVKIKTDESYITPLMMLFKRRGSKK